VGDAKRAVKESIEQLRKELRAATAQHRTLEAEIDHAFNPYWGPLFREGYEISKFGEQVEAYACVYTSRVSNFRFYSPMQYFRGPRDRMPHGVARHPGCTMGRCEASCGCRQPGAGGLRRGAAEGFAGPRAPGQFGITAVGVRAR
jgi:hypothetical protein